MLHRELREALEQTHLQWNVWLQPSVYTGCSDSSSMQIAHSSTAGSGGGALGPVPKASPPTSSASACCLLLLLLCAGLLGVVALLTSSDGVVGPGSAASTSPARRSGGRLFVAVVELARGIPGGDSRRTATPAGPCGARAAARGVRGRPTCAWTAAATSTQPGQSQPWRGHRRQRRPRRWRSSPGAAVPVGEQD